MSPLSLYLFSKLVMIFIIFSTYSVVIFLLYLGCCNTTLNVWILTSFILKSVWSINQLVGHLSPFKACLRFYYNIQQFLLWVEIHFFPFTVWSLKLAFSSQHCVSCFLTYLAEYCFACGQLSMQPKISLRRPLGIFLEFLLYTWNEPSWWVQ